MANKVTTNPIQVDSTGRLFNIGTLVTITGIKVVPSGATWSVVLKDDAGNIVYQDNNNAGAEEVAIPINCTGLSVDTLTSITLLLIYHIS
jgi:hypothetical protein